MTLAAVTLAVPGKAGAGVRTWGADPVSWYHRSTLTQSLQQSVITNFLTTHKLNCTEKPDHSFDKLVLSHTSQRLGPWCQTPQRTMATRAGSLVSSAMEAAAALGKLPRATIAASLVGLLTAAFSARVAYRWYRLSHIPGPFWASFSSLWMVKVTLEGRAPEAWKEATDKYGAAGSPLIFTFDARLWR